MDLGGRGGGGQVVHRDAAFGLVDELLELRFGERPEPAGVDLTDGHDGGVVERGSQLEQLVEVAAAGRDDGPAARGAFEDRSEPLPDLAVAGAIDRTVLLVPLPMEHFSRIICYN